MALFIAILLQPALAWFEKKHWPFSISLAVISMSTLTILWLFGMLVYRTGKSIVAQKDKLLGQIDVRLEGVLGWVNTLPGVSLEAGGVTDLLSNILTYDWLLKSSGEFAGLLGSFTGSFFMTALYLIALIGGILRYEQYIGYLKSGRQDEEAKLLAGFEQVKASIVTYMKVKFLISILTGLGYYLVCLVFGIDFALFWGFLAFVLNFVPTFGSIVATIPPMLLALVQVESFGTIGLVAGLLIIVQVVFGNIIEPKLMGASLKLNTVTVILGLLFWGYLWGVAGMVLSVPLLVLMKVVLGQFSGAGILVKLMSGGNMTDMDDSLPK